MLLTEAEREYLSSQILGRLATVGADGVLQNSPVGFFYNAEAGTIDIGGHRMDTSQKFRNVAANGRAAFVVDDIASLNPWRVRGIEFRGRAEALRDQPPLRPGFSREIIRIHPRRILSWGLDGPASPLRARTSD